MNNIFKFYFSQKVNTIKKVKRLYIAVNIEIKKIEIIETK